MFRRRAGGHLRVYRRPPHPPAVAVALPALGPRCVPAPRNVLILPAGGIRRNAPPGGLLATLAYCLSRHAGRRMTKRSLRSLSRLKCGMRHFQWSEENEVFLTQIDAEHRDLFQIADGLQQAVANKNTAGVHAQLHAFIAHAEEHFSHQEWLMQSVKYPSYGCHLQQHNTARRRLKLLAPLVASDESEAAELLLDFLEGWL